MRAAIERHAGEAAFIQRCQLHKIRNVLAYLPETHQHWFKYKLRVAYAEADLADARQALYRLHDELNELHPSPAASLMEGLEETLTSHDLQVHARLRWVASALLYAETGWNRLHGYRHRRCLFIICSVLMSCVLT